MRGFCKTECLTFKAETRKLVSALNVKFSVGKNQTYSVLLLIEEGHIEKELSGIIFACTQPMSDEVTMQHRLSLAGLIHRIIPAVCVRTPPKTRNETAAISNKLLSEQQHPKNWQKLV